MKQPTLFSLTVIKRPHYIYLFATETNDRAQKCKIGITESNQLENRLSKVCCSSGHNCRVLHVVPCPTRGQALAGEKALHNRFARQRLRGEWFFLAQRDIDLVRKVQSIEHMLQMCNDGEFHPIDIAPAAPSLVPKDKKYEYISRQVIINSPDIAA